VEIVIVLSLVGLLLASGALALFARTLRDRSWQHTDRMALFPIQEDAPRLAATEQRPEGAGRTS
jgi:hypothetical protein